MVDAGPGPSHRLYGPPYSLSSSSSTPSHQGNNLSAGMLNSGQSSRPSSGPDIHHARRVSIPSGPDFKPLTYGYPYGPGPSPTETGPPGYGDFNYHGSPRAATPGMSNSHLPSISLHAQKRAYRQRRKDPSCDACRERKVKCDATDITSCSECSSRNVKCQFTKETNRRMSSIKQVQDLERQLAHTRKQLQELRSAAKDENTSRYDSTLHSKIQSRDMDPSPRPGTRHVPEKDLSRARSNLRRLGAGLFKPPFPYNIHPVDRTPYPSLPGLPPRHIADQILGQYHVSFHSTLPILHWPSFLQQYETVYSQGSLRGTARTWGALFFAVLGCGTLQRVREDGRYYLERSRSLTDPYEEDLTLDHARCALLTSIILVELNLKSAGWVSLGVALRIAQDLGLHRETKNQLTVENEMRRRVWWSIYTCDRLLSLELGRPGLINNMECDIELPSPMDDQHIPSAGSWSPPHSPQSPSPLIASFEVINAVSKVLEALRKPSIPRETLTSCDLMFSDCVAAFPERHQLRSEDYIHPYELAPLMYLQNARFMLYRHNMTPSCSIIERAAAIDRCCIVGQDTVQLLARSMRDQPRSSPSARDIWKSSLESAASTFLSTHLWRCLLVLSFRKQYSAAIVCARASAVIGDARLVNVICGRYIDFYLRRLADKIHQGERIHIESDEELIAYISGDLQGSIETSWVWQSTEGEPHGRTFGKLLHEEPSNLEGAGGHSAEREGANEWSGWDEILKLLELAQEEDQHARPHTYGDSNTRPEPTVVSPVPSQNHIPPRAASHNPSRISIADII